MQLEWDEKLVKWRYGCDLCGWRTRWVHHYIGPVSKAKTVMEEVLGHSCAMALIEKGETHGRKQTT